FAEKLAAEQVDPLGDLVSSFGEELAAEQVNALGDLVSRFAGAEPDAMPLLAEGFAAGLAKNPKALGHVLGWLADDGSGAMPELLAAFADVDLATNAINQTIEGYVAALDLDDATTLTLTNLAEGYAANLLLNPTDLGRALVPYVGEADVEQL